MYKNLFRNLALLFLWVIQLLVFVASFFAFSSTMKIFSWYEPLTMGAFLVLIYLVPIQTIDILVARVMLNKMQIPKVYNVIPIVNLCILISILFFTITNEKLFYPFAKVNTVIECLLIVIWLLSLIKFLIKKAQKT